MVSLNDLPPKLREQALRQLNSTTSKPTKDRSSTVKTNGVCHGCGVRFTSTAAWEKHSDAEGHRRFDLIGGLA